MIRNFLEMEERSWSGQAVDKETWDLDYVALQIADLVEEFDLTRDRDEIVCTDQDKIRRFYEAGRQLVLRSGVYNQSTGRIIAFTEEEVDEGARQQRKTLPMGSGKDAFTLYARQPEDPRKPGVVAGNPGCPMTEEEFCATVRSWAQEPAVDLVTCGSIVDVDGRKVRSASVSEVLAVRRELTHLNRICADVGRPGLGRLAAESAVSEVGDLAAMASGLIREGDAHLVALNNELIINNDNLVRAAANLHFGVRNASLACVMVEGLAGGAPGAAVCMIASMLAANLVCRADYHLCHPSHLRHIATSTRECMWLQSVVCQAFAACAPNIIVCDIYPKSGAGTRELLLETAANALAITVSGGHLEGVGSCDGLKPHCSGLEARVMGEVGRAAAQQGITRTQANGMILKLLEAYEPVFAAGNEGQHFTQVYDPLRMEPTEQWLALYRQVREELAGLGLTL